MEKLAVRESGEAQHSAEAPTPVTLGDYARQHRHGVLERNAVRR